MITDAQRKKRELGLCEWRECPEPAEYVATPVDAAEPFRHAWRYCAEHSEGLPALGWHLARLKEKAS
jgi:hypothetical protein